MAAELVHLVAGPADGPLDEIAPFAHQTPVALSPTDPLRVAMRQKRVLSFEEPHPAGRAAPSRAAVARAEVLGIAAVVPLTAGDALEGALLVGPRRDGRLYTRDDVLLLETLAAQSSVAIENARALGVSARARAPAALARISTCAKRSSSTPTTAGSGRPQRTRSARCWRRSSASRRPTRTVLVVGETGTGKELAVRALHARSPRADRILVKVACAAMPDALIESELFGYERGAFTGATQGQAGASRGRRRRHALPRRRRHAAARRPGEAAARGPGGRGAAHRFATRCATSTCASSPPPTGPARRGARRALPRGPLLPAPRRADPACRRCASAPRTSRCWSSTSSRARRRASGGESPRSRPRAMEQLQQLRVAGQHPRAAQRDRARAGDEPAASVLRLPAPLRADAAASQSLRRRSRARSPSPSWSSARRSSGSARRSNAAAAISGAPPNCSACTGRASRA